MAKKLNSVGMDSSGLFSIAESGDTLSNIVDATTIKVQKGDGTGILVDADKTDIGLGNVDNTSDANKPVSTATQTALNLKASISSLAAAAFSGAYSALIGLPTLFSGVYSDLTGKPTIPAAQIQSDYTQASTGSLDYIKNKPAIPSVTRTTSTLSLSLVGTGATGTQISSTKDSSVRLTCSVSNTSSIGGPATSVVVLKKCATNNATEGSWTTVATLENDQTVTLAIALLSIQVVKGQLSCDLPSGWFVKLVNSGTGTHAETFISGEQTIYG